MALWVRCGGSGGGGGGGVVGGDPNRIQRLGDGQPVEREGGWRGGLAEWLVQQRGGRVESTQLLVYYLNLF